MEVLFRGNEILIYTNNYGILDWNYINLFPNVDLANIKHLDDVEPLYHYRDTTTNETHPVYYEINGRFLTNKSNRYYIINLNSNYIKDNTLTNLNLI